ncbi:MAG: 3-oxoacyl-ACP reductase FabG [Deltaproteobacteria bacterium]|nr:3-oxoacyl-ACP reductase FabG [Deltaproteobacteria bacterium]
MRGIQGKRVLITGAAGGIGRATAQRFHEEGARLLLCDLRPLESTELKPLFPDRMDYVAADIATSAGLAALEAAIKDGGVDVLVNNAGITKDKSALKLSVEDWDQVLAVNLTAVFRLAQLAARAMKEQGRGGVILNAASVVAHNGNFGQANYVATKAGVIGLTKTLARELGRVNIRVNAVAPGFIDTPMARAVPADHLASLCERTPAGRLGKPEEIAAAYCFLASDDAAFITGTVLNVDGGLVM